MTRSSAIRVVHVVVSLAPGGLERMVIDLANARNQRHPGSTLICCLDEIGELARQVEGEAVICVHANRARLPFDFAAVARLRRQVTRSKGQGSSGKSEGPTTQQPFDCAQGRPGNSATVLHAHNMAAWQYGVLATIGTGAKLVYTQHGANVHNEGFVNRMRSRLLARFTDRIVAVSASTAQTMAEKQGISRDEIVVIPNGVPVGKRVSSACPDGGGVECRVLALPEAGSNAEYGNGNPSTALRASPEPCYAQRASQGKSETKNSTTQQPNNPTTAASTFRVERGIPLTAFVVGSVGRFSPEKNYPLLVRAFADFRMKCPGSFLVLVGDGEERGRIEDVAREFGVTGCCCLPGMQGDVEPWLRAMDVFCLSSNTEGMPVSLLEAGALELPAVVTDVGANTEVVEHGVTGWVVPCGNPEAMAAALEKLYRERALGVGMGRQARRRIMERYSLDKTMESYEHAYAAP